MGIRARLTNSDDTSLEEIDGSQVHAMGVTRGEYTTMCGIPPLDGAEEERVRCAVNCEQCLDVIRAAAEFKRRNGKWY